MSTRDPRERPQAEEPRREPSEIRKPRPQPEAARDRRYTREAAVAGGGGWREEVMSASGLNVLAGVWLIISPWIVGYEDADALWNPIAFGAIVTTLGLARAAGAFRQTWLSWVNAAIGIWLFASAFWLADSAEASWNVGIVGTIVFLLAVWSAAASGGAAVRRA